MKPEDIKPVNEDQSTVTMWGHTTRFGIYRIDSHKGLYTALCHQREREAERLGQSSVKTWGKEHPFNSLEKAKQWCVDHNRELERIYSDQGGA